MVDIDIKKLTKLQKQKADKITQLIIELKKSGVYMNVARKPLPSWWG